jgi:deferrochelatase/peroxidase EfeB
MTHALVTIISPLALDRVAAAEASIDALGNPPRDDIRAALDKLDASDGTHFCSLHAVRSKHLGKAYLAFEFSADGTEDEAVSRIVRAIGPDLATVFSLANDWTAGTEIYAYLTAHKISIGVGLFDSPGLAFAGTPGRSVGRIRAEQKLALRVTEILASQGEDMWALERVNAVREALHGDAELSDMLETGTAAPPYAPLGTVGLIVKLFGSFLATYLWPVGILLLLMGLIGGIWNSGHAIGFWSALGAFICGALKWSIITGVTATIALVVALLVGYFELRSLEERDSLEERTADPATLASIFQRENHHTQNHMISVTQRKPGFIRWFTARLVFWVIGRLATYRYPPGFLSDIGTIHFARWVTPPGTRDLLFFSNFDGSWESYLEDFITKAHDGLTGVWSNSIGFPRSENLFQKGATDGERFKRYARQSMFPTRFWYSAYPTLTTNTIRTNATIRLGLSGALTEDEAASWLALFGSAARPAVKLVNSEIQSIIFGGLGFMPCGTSLFYDLPETVVDARSWLAEIMPNIAFNDGRRLKQKAVATFAVGPEGLKRLGLPEQGLQTFPNAFLTGLTDDARARLLGDTGDNAVDKWRWGKIAPHTALLVYGKTADDVAALKSKLDESAAAHGVQLTHSVPLKEITIDKREPFGFADGISQPVIRGTYKGLKAADPIHLVEPGEFILGYPDNRGNMPPGPTLPATADPRNILPLVDTAGDFTRNFVDGVRDLGRNGSFLVIRELEQYVETFSAYCQAEAERLNERLPEPYEVTAEFVGAKLVGRWHNGSSIIRHPYLPKHDHEKAAGREPETAHSHPDAGAERPTTRPETSSVAPTPVERPAKASHLQDNDFLFGTEDPEAIRCPFGAHIRRANPRDSLEPGSQDQIDISNRHRIIRIGRQYMPNDGNNPGLFFMCLNGDLERQFEFIQQTWLKSPSFHGLSCEKDPLLGDAESGMCGYTIPSRYGPVRLSPVPAMVATRGGGYFFLPGKRLLDFLAIAT